MKKTFIIFAYLLLFANISCMFGQDRPIRVGLKIGWPSLAGLNAEYVLPFFNKRISAEGDFSYIPFSVTESSNSVKSSYIRYSIGANYYLFSGGQGIYCGFSYNYLNLYGDFKIFDGGVYANWEVNDLILKVGGKHGGFVYFRWDIGYSVLSDNPLASYTDNINGKIIRNNFDKTFAEVLRFSSNIGIGVSF
jgi:hypothetical protein